VLASKTPFVVGEIIEDDIKRNGLPFETKVKVIAVTDADDFKAQQDAFLEPYGDISKYCFFGRVIAE